MNKQAFTFLTLFSLILVLSIYYIMLPPNQNEKTVTQTQTNNWTVTKNSWIKKEKILLKKTNEIIAKESSTSDSINKALATISETKNIGEKEKSIVAKVKELGYQDAYVEIEIKQSR